MIVPESSIERGLCDICSIDSSVDPSLGSIKSIASVVGACHGAFDIDSIRIDNELPADALALGRNSMRSLFVVRAFGRKSTSSKAANRQDIFSQRNLEVAIANVRHLDGKHETSFVFLNLEVVFVFLREAIRRRH